MPPDQENPENQIDQWHDTLRALLRGLPTDYAERFEALRQLRSVCHQEIAADLETSLDTYARAQRLDTANDRREFTVGLRHAVQELGLTLVCPRTGRPAVLAVATEDNLASGPPRFQVLVNDDAGGVITTMESLEPPPIRVREVEDTLGRSPFAWRLGRRGPPKAR